MTDAVEGVEGAPAEEEDEGQAEPQDSSPHGALPTLALAALGVVFGDIGTSPLYALHTVFTLDHGRVKPTTADVYGVISMVFWSVTLIVSIKYVSVIMRADNGGEGGVMALAQIAKRALGKDSRRIGTVLVLAIIGASMFFGDSVITPAISVLSAVEGVSVVAPGLDHLVLPIAGTILVLLFGAQRFGTHRVAGLFGPVMLLWFAALAAAGLAELVRRPSVLEALSPTYGLEFIGSHPATTFVAMGAIVLCITGAEALYADMGHFGRSPIALAWFAAVFPALTLQYLGQAALILRDRSAIDNPFYLLVPDSLQIVMVVLATAATVIASQAVISGAFSVSRQASQLGLLPPLTVKQTSDESAGQVYLPVINTVLFLLVLVVLLAFGSSARLATAYGISVTGALLVDTVMLIVVARIHWHWPVWRLVLIGVFFGLVEFVFFAANVTKIVHGGWVPLLIAGSIFAVMSTWHRGREVVVAHRIEVEGKLADFVESVHEDPPMRVPGIAVFPHPTKETTPLAMRENVEHNRVIHERVIVFTAEPLTVPHVRGRKQVSVDDLGYADDGIMHVTMKYGFFDRPDIPRTLAAHQDDEGWEFALEPDQVTYFLSRGALKVSAEPTMARWRKVLFVILARNAADPAAYFNLPVDRTVVMGSQIEL